MDNNLLYLAYLLLLRDSQGGGAPDRKGCLKALGLTVLIYAVVFLLIMLLVHW